MTNEVLTYYKFLVKLRNSGVTNMWGGAEYLEEAYDIPNDEAGEVLINWINSFKLPKEEQPNDGRYDAYDGRYDNYDVESEVSI